MSTRNVMHLCLLGVGLVAVVLQLRAVPVADQASASDGEPTVLSAEMGNLEGAWRFRTDPEDAGETSNWHTVQYDDNGWRQLRAPGNWEAQGITDPRPGQPAKPRNGLPWTDYDGVAWYRKQVIVPAEWRGKPLVLQLGSVDDADRTFVNGVLVGETRISRAQAVLVDRTYRIDPKLVKPGAANVIAVRVTDGGGPGGIMGPALSLVPAELLTAPVLLPGTDRPFAERFANPPAAARMLKIIHGWPDGPDAQDALIRTLAQQGFGGVVCNVSFENYLKSDAKWQAFVRAVREASGAGMSMWLYDEKGYPSGAAGGLTLEGHPEWEARGLLIADALTEGEPVELALPPGNLVAAEAYPVRADGSLDLKNRRRLPATQGALRWTPPAGRWYVAAITEDRLYDGTHAANSLGDKLPYVNLLMPEPTARFIELTHGAYAKLLGNDLGRSFVSTFTDEPSLMSLFMRRMPYRVLPWSANMASEFRKRRGYDLTASVPLLIGGKGPASAKARYDYWKTVAELVAENYFGQIRKWCTAHSIHSGGHLLMEENLTHHVPLYGDFFASIRQMDAPSIDCLTSIPAEVPWHIARMIGSVADLQGHSVTMCETSDFVQFYREQGDQRPVRTVSEAEIRGTCNRLMLGGIHTITSYYTFRELTGAQLRRLNEYVGRCSTALTGGHQVADIAVVYPIESAWVRFIPSRHMTSEAGEAALVEKTFRNASEALFAARRDFTYLDTKAIMDARVEKGALVNGRLRWRVVVLPHTDTLPLAAWRKLEQLVTSGGVLISVGALPANSEARFPAAEVVRIADRVFGGGSGLRVRPVGNGGAGVFLPDGSEHLLRPLLDRLLEPDIEVTDRQAPLRLTHRRIDGAELFFVVNDGGAPWSGEVSVSAAGRGEVWDPMTGSRRDLPGPERIGLALEPYGSAILRFEGHRSPRRHSAGAAELPSVSRRPLQPERVSYGAGEHVRASIIEAADGAGRSWRIVGTLTRGNVDTHLFAVLHYSQGADLAGDETLTVRLRVPENQPSAPQLLLILTDARGVQYWAETGRPLSIGGRAEIILPLSRFAHAPFSAGPTGPLDWKRITAINVGWGGHFGKEGDKIEFTLEAVEAGRLARP